MSNVGPNTLDDKTVMNGILQLYNFVHSPVTYVIVEQEIWVVQIEILNRYKVRSSPLFSFQTSVCMY